MENLSSPTLCPTCSLHRLHISGDTDVSSTRMQIDPTLSQLQKVEVLENLEDVAVTTGTSTYRELTLLDNRMRRLRKVRKGYERALAQIERSLDMEIQRTSLHKISRTQPS